MKNTTKKFTWGENSYELYTPKRNKVKVGMLFAFVGFLFATPMTNWLLIPTIKILNKTMWLY